MLNEQRAQSRVAMLDGIETPPSRGGLLLNQKVPAIAAWIGVRVLTKPLRIGKTVIAARHRDVSDILQRDLDFCIAPVNAERIEAVNGPFVLGMDRSDRLTIERRALYSAMSTIDLKALTNQITVDAQNLIADADDDSIDAVGSYARIVAGRTAKRLFGIAGPDEKTFLEVVRAIFAHTFLNLGGDKTVEARALKAAVLMRGWFESEIVRRRQNGITGEDFMGALMRQPTLDDDAVRRTLGGMLVGSIDTTASAVAKILVVFGGDRQLFQSALSDAEDLTSMLGWCREALRRWPHNPLVQRKTIADTTLNGVAIPAGSLVYAWTQAAMQDSQAFPEPQQMRPDRPGKSYLHFGGGLHPCAGRMINDLQVPLLVSTLLRRGVEKVGRVSWAGPFPNHLPIALRRV